MCFWKAAMTERQKREAKFLDGAGSEITGIIEVDPETYEIQNRYYIKDKECKKIILESKQAKNFAAYALIKKDLKFVKKAFSAAAKFASDETDSDSSNGGVRYRAEFDEDADILKSLYISGVVTYGKCFTKADGRKVKLEARDVFGPNQSKEKDLHMEVMTQRHSYLAHGGNTKHERVNAVLVLNPVDKGKPPVLLTEATHTAGFGKNDFEELLALAEFVDSRVDEVLETKSNSLFEKEIAPVPIEKWYE
jgi:hypothetical protein